MLKDIIEDIWNNYRGRFLCSLTGLVISSLFLLLGFWATLFVPVIALVALLLAVMYLDLGGGFFIGYKIDKKEDLVEWLDRLLPPGYHR